MVQRILGRASTSSVWRIAAWACCLLVITIAPVFAAKRQKAQAVPTPPDLLLEGGRKLTFERVFTSERDIRGKAGFWTKLANIVAGEPDYKRLVRPYGIAVDSQGRLIVSDPGLGGVHVFDPGQHKYKFLERKEKIKDPMLEPQCVAVDAKDNIYVTDSSAGKVFVFGQNGKYQRALGSLKGGEGYFKRPTGIAIDPDTQDIYVTDTLRHRIYVLNPQGEILRTIGKRGSGNGEFNFPTELRIKNGMLAVVDAMNFRVETFDRAGHFLSTFGNLGDSGGQVFRPKGIAIDSENHIYLVEGLWGTVQVFDREGQLLYHFGQRGTALGEFQLPAGLFIDNNDAIYVVDSYNRRVEVFQYHGVKTAAAGAMP